MIPKSLGQSLYAHECRSETAWILLSAPMFARVLARRVPNFARKASLRSYATMFGDNCPLVVTPAQLHNLKASEPSSQDLVVLDASWHMPNSPRKPDSEFLASHIPSARFLDIDRVASPHPLSLPHMMPDPKTFVDACCKDNAPYMSRYNEMTEFLP